MSFDGTLIRGSASFTPGAARFGAGGRTAGAAQVYSLGTVDDALINSFTGTIEYWKKLDTPDALRVDISGRNGFLWIGNDASGLLTVSWPGIAGGLQIITGAQTATGTFHHIALVFTPTSASVYLDGNRVYIAGPFTTFAAASSSAAIGGLAAASDYDSLAALDEVRFSTVARYIGATYTVPTGAFPDTSAGTRALYHLNTDVTDTAATMIPPNDTNLIYSPYNWDVGASAAISINSGSYAKALIGGGATSATLNFDLSGLAGNVPQIWTRVDDGPWTKASLSATITLPFPASTAAWGVHFVEFVVKAISTAQVKWSGVAAQVKLTGISTAPAGGYTQVVTRRALRILVYGDSVTEGLYTTNINGSSPELDAYDAMQTYAWRLAEDLGAEVGVIGFGGQGWTVTGVGGVPALQNAWSLLRSSVTRDLTTAPPDLIVINEGANDFSDPTATVTTVLNAILTATPTTTLIAVMRPFNGAQATYLQAGIAACSAPKRVRYIDTTGWWSVVDSSDGLHPWGYAHTGSLAPRLAATLREVLASGATYINVSGAAKKTSLVRS